MKIYWDTSAVVSYFAQGRTNEIAGVTRPHTLAEIFSALTGGGFYWVKPDGSRKHKKLGISAAAHVIKTLSSRFQYVELSADDTVKAIAEAKAKNVQGGRIHDLMHMAAAEKAGADELWTADRNDFVGLGKVPLKHL